MRLRDYRPSFASGVTGICVAVCLAFTFSQLQPSLLFADTTTAGGDMGAHVWAPQYLRDHLLPHLRLTGWTPDWYAGFPALHFYFPLPSIAIVLLDLVLPYNVAFKLITVAGVCTIPISAWAFGRLGGLPFPVPACLAAASVPFLFDTGYSILGGNIASTLAGEFAFSIGLSLTFVFLGLVAGGLHTGKHRAWAALVFGLVIMSHVLPTILAFVGGVILLLMRLILTPSEERDPWWRSRLNLFRWGVPVALFGGLLSAWWLLPFVARMGFMNDMGWEKIGVGTESGMKLYEKTIVNYSDALVSAPPSALVALAAGGAAVSLVLRRRIGIFFVILAAIAACAFVWMPQGQLWNARILPFWYLSLYMLAGLLIGEVGWGLADLLRRMRSTAADDVAEGLSVATPTIATTAALIIVMSALPAPNWWPERFARPWNQPGESAQSYIPGWAEWNYSGYERKTAYPEYEALVQTMTDLGRERGCGRAMWEYESDLDRFGTPMALMLLPKWTDGCIGSMEGLFFESSATVPYHFLNQSELSMGPSRAMRNLPYDSLNVSEGVSKLQLLGVKYYMAVTPEAQEQAATDFRLELVRSVPAAPAKSSDGTVTGGARTWNIYEITGSEPVVSLNSLPNVMTNPEGVTTDFDIHPEEVEMNARELWATNAIHWYREPFNFDVPLAADGPSEWPRVEDGDDPAARVPVEPAEVTYTSTGDDRIRFTVDRIGVPVLVKASYFPNWEVEGASGPYRVSPNQMVVIPTETNVSLHYGRTAIDWGAAGLSLLGAAGILWLARRPAFWEAQEERAPEIDVYDG